MYPFMQKNNNSLQRINNCLSMIQRVPGMYCNLVNYSCFSYSLPVHLKKFSLFGGEKNKIFDFCSLRDFTLNQFQLYCTFYTTTSEGQDQKQGCRLSYKGGRHGFSTTTCPHNRHGTCDYREVFARCPLIHIPRDRRHTLCIPHAEECI